MIVMLLLRIAIFGLLGFGWSSFFVPVLRRYLLPSRPALLVLSTGGALCAAVLLSLALPPVTP